MYNLSACGHALADAEIVPVNEPASLRKDGFCSGANWKNGYVRVGRMTAALPFLAKERKVRAPQDTALGNTQSR